MSFTESPENGPGIARGSLVISASFTQFALGQQAVEAEPPRQIVGLGAVGEGLIAQAADKVGVARMRRGKFSEASHIKLIGDCHGEDGGEFARVGADDTGPENLAGT